MPESQKLVGINPVVEAGTVLLGPDDGSFTIKISDLSFSIWFVHDSHQPPVKTAQIATDNMAMRVWLNTWQTPTPTFKVKVGVLWGKDLFLAVRLEHFENFRVLTYTFSTDGR